MNPNKIILSNDHAAVDSKLVLQTYLKSKKYEIINVGTNNKNSVHYPCYAKKAASLVKNIPDSVAIVLCGTGVGISLASNKIKGIRCMICHTPLVAKIAREQFDINVLGIGANIIGAGLIQVIVDKFLSTPFNPKYIENKNFLDKMIN